MSDSDTMIFSLLGLGVFALIVLWLIGLVPTWLVIQGQWDSFPWWLSANIQVSRVLFALICPLYIFVAFTGKITYFSKGIDAGILAIWGLPLYRKTIMKLAFDELLGLEFQRAVLIMIFILALEISVYNTEGSSSDNQK